MSEQQALPEEAKDFWEQRYVQSVERARGKAGKFLQEFVSELAPKRALELGCSTGDDSLWLAEKGWQVTAVDISDHAVQTAQRLAQEAGLASKINFSAVDLAQSFPEGEFEFACALYFQSPYEFPRAQILQTAASRIVSGGHLLLVSHASGPPWGKQLHQHHVFPTLETEINDLGLNKTDWEYLDLSEKKRLAKGPEGQEAELKDNLIFARRR